MKKITLLSAAIAVGLASAPAAADIELSGFASLHGAVNTDAVNPHTGKEETDIDFSEFSKVGLQANADINDDLSVTAQFLGKGADNYSPELEWAFASYRAADNLRINVGKQRLPLYKYSDFLDVGYAFNYVTPSKAVYSSIFTSYEGVSAHYDFAFGKADMNIQAFFGNSEQKSDLGQGASVKASLDDTVGFVFNANAGATTFRASFVSTKATADWQNHPVGDLTNALGNAGLSMAADSLKMNDDDVVFYGLSASRQWGQWFTEVEYVAAEIEDSWYADEAAYYVTVGRSFGDITAYYQYQKSDDAVSDDNATAYIPDAPVTAPLSMATDTVLTAMTDTSEYHTVGARYDFAANTALKFQATQKDINATGETENTVTLGVDVVF